MKYALIAGLVLAAAAIALLAILYFRYRRSPNGAWKRRVLDAVSHAERRRRDADRAILASNDPRPLDKLRKDHVEQYLRNQPINVLTKYPGIGPGIVGWLENAGVRSVHDARQVRLESITNIGSGRAGDIIAAIRSFANDAASKLEAGACAEAKEYKRDLANLTAERDRQRFEAELEKKSALADLSYLSEVRRVADRISFFGYLSKSPVNGLTPETMAFPLERPHSSHAEVTRPTPPAPPPVAPEDSGPKVAPASKPESRTAPSPVEPESISPPELPAPVKPITPPEPPAPAEPIAIIRLKTVAQFGFAVARCDGRIANAERNQIRVFLERRYTSDPAAARELTAALSQAEEGTPDLGTALWQVRRDIPSEGWADLHQFAISITNASGAKSPRKDACINRVVEELGIGQASAPISTPTTPAPVPETTSTGMSEAECRISLEIAAGVPFSVDLIRRQYRLLNERYAPSKFETHGDDFVRMAQEKRARAEAAARQLLTAYNEPLEAPDIPAPPADIRHNPDLDAVFGA